jgi:hypothetical protein
MTTNSQVTAATNISGPDLGINPNNTPQYFNNFYSLDFSVAPNVDAAMLGFFTQHVGNPVAAKNLAATVLYSAIATGVDPMAVLAEFQKLPPGSVNNYLTAFLNSNRAQTSALGLAGTQQTNKFVSRTLLL